LHGNNSELVFLVDPDEERFGVVVEDASAFGPVTVKVASFEETISFLEEEVVSNELAAVSFAQGTERVVCSSELSSEALAGLNDCLLDGVSLFASDARAEREVSQVTADSDTSGLDHGGVLRGEGRTLELGVIHVALVTS
jgi:hypothetical protein